MQRRSIRWRGYDYTQNGAYFVTLCTHDRSHMLDNTILKQIVQKTWDDLPKRFPSIVLDEFVIMPNHVHFVLRIESVGSDTEKKAGASPAPTLGDVVGAFKSLSARGWLKWVRENESDKSARLWQRNYYDRVIRNEMELNRIRQYIRNNPAQWAQDHENPHR